METRTIEQLATTATELENDDLIPIWQNGRTKKISGTNFFKNRSSTPVDVVEDGNMHAVTSNAVADVLSYSTTETLTGGKWIDGKPIYRKVIDCGAMPNNTVKLVAHNISNLDNTISISGYAKSTIETLPLPFSGILGVIEAYTNSTDIKIGSNLDLSSYSGYIIVEYTKTTD